MPTLKDLSRHLNLSVTQVSRALNGHGDVSEETRKRVEAAARAMKYRPNLSARSLVTGRSGLLGLVVPKLPEGPADAPFVEVIGGLSRHISRAGMQFILHVSEGADDIEDVYGRLIDGGSLDGFVLLEPKVDDPRVAYLKARGIPFVVHGLGNSGADFPFYDIDNRRVGHLLTHHLLENGHERIAFVNGPAGLAYVADREEGYSAALASYGLAARDEWHVTGRMSEEYGLLSTIRFFDGEPSPPTAVIAGNLLIAKGVYLALRTLGLRVPEDVSVVAHDDLIPDVPAETFHPALTCTEAPLHDSWEPLAQSLLGAVSGDTLETLQRMGALDFKARASVAKLD